MNTHTGRDAVTRAKFHIVGFDEAAGIIELHQNKDGWVKDSSETAKMHWADFISGLMTGQLEIHPLK
jgi:hypothetical protein